MEIVSNTYLSTSAGYAILSYRTAYLKANYFLEYATSVLRSVQEDKKKLTSYASIVKSKGVEILFPAINKSNVNMDIYDFNNNVIITGLLSVKGLPEEMAKNIVAEREENGHFTSYENFIDRMMKYHIDRKSMTSLIYAGCFDEFDKNVERLISYYEYVGEHHKATEELRSGKQRTIFDIPSFSKKISYLEFVPDNNGYNLQDRLAMLCEYNNVGIHTDVTSSYKNIRYDLTMAKWQRDEEYDTKEGVVSGVLEDEFVISKKGKAYLTTLRTFNGDIIKLILSKAKASDVAEDLSMYKKGMAIDVIGSFKFPKIQENDGEEGDEETQGFVNTDVVCFPNGLTIKALDKPFIPIKIELNLDDRMVSESDVCKCFGKESFKQVIGTVFSNVAKDNMGKEITIILGGNTYTYSKKIDVSLDEIKKLGCTYKVVS